MLYPTYRDRYLPSMTLRQINEMPTKARIPVLIATGAIEQHGPHLPVGVDALLGQARLDAALPLLAETCRLVVAPPIQIGKSNEHVGYPGTLFIDKETLRQQLLAIARQVHAWGFRVLLILNTHGGNSAVIRYTMAEIEDSLGMQTEFLRLPVKLPISKQEAAYGFHANEVETSLMLEIMDGQAIDMSGAVCCYPAQVEDPGELRPECAPAIYSWVSSDISPSGIMGDAPSGTRDKGRDWFAMETQALVQALTRICDQLQD